jgi:hypothetical protein
MNAYNLADELDNIDAYEKHQILLGKSADMLRQQQVEIEALKALNKSIIDDPLQFMKIKAQEK